MLFFYKCYNGFTKSDIKGLTNTHGYYSALKWLYPMLRIPYPNHVISLRELGLAMIRAAKSGQARAIVHSKAISEMAK
ncbi:hypothetical protein [Candidatus Pristimantibacillus sp. PTI5]|uniref:hypothetical protein n=1 Tax=Candidatus Pristimantibacillus sp. PTI5 TaxID=3400422 RepID=UPI003B0132C9